MSIPQSNLDELMKDPKAAGLLKNKALLQTILNAPDTQRLIQLLDQKAGGDLKQAASSAAKADTQALTGLVRQVMGSQEGAKLIHQLNQKLEQSKS